MSGGLPFHVLDVGRYFSEKDLVRMQEICTQRSCSLEAFIAGAAVARLDDAETVAGSTARELLVALRLVMSYPGIRAHIGSQAAGTADMAMHHAEGRV